MKKFTAQMKSAVEIAESMYPKVEGYRLCFVFDTSSCHNAMADDALNANRMNVKPGGSQRIMRDNQYNGKIQKMYFIQHEQRAAKGLKLVLEERGISTEKKNKQ